MVTLKFALDEDVSHDLASLLRSLGHDADSAKELRRLGMSDVQVLLSAVRDDQTLVTHNSNDFRMLQESWVTWRRRWSNEIEQIVGRSLDLSRHAGILIVPHLRPYELASLLMEFERNSASVEDRLFAWSQTRLWHEVRY